MRTSARARNDDIRYCNRCGNLLQPGEEFCRRCGALTPRSSVEFIGFWTRSVAYVIDQIVLYGLFILLCLLVIGTGLFEGHSLFSDPLSAIYFAFCILIAFYCTYHVVFTGLLGQTLGKMALGVRMVNDQGRPPGIPRAIMREVIGKLLSGVLCIGFIWVAFDREKRAWHDHIAGTYVVRARR